VEAVRQVLGASHPMKVTYQLTRNLPPPPPSPPLFRIAWGKCFPSFLIFSVSAIEIQAGDKDIVIAESFYEVYYSTPMGSMQKPHDNEQHC